MIKLKCKKTLIAVFLIFVVFSCSVVLRLERYTENTNTQNLDASYHVLLTIDAMKNNPIKEHLFLPIVSLGEQEDKYIPWGATIPNNQGDYFYTSFPQLGFIVPYIVFDLFDLDSTISNLMILNMFIHLTCSLLLFTLILLISRKISNNRSIQLSLAVAGACIYIFNIESLFSQGIVYWAHSLFQLFWIMQLIVFYFIFERGKNSRYILLLFLILSFSTPATEWTGYLTNFIIFLILLISSFKNSKYVVPLVIVVVSTILSIVFFVVPFVVAIGQNQLMVALKARFYARNATNSISWKYLFQGYWDSFYPFLIVLGILLLFIILNKRIRENYIGNFRKVRVWVLIVAFPMIENAIMKEHAILYSFDRLKLVLLIILLLIIGIGSVKKRERVILITLILLAVISSVFQYIKTDRIWNEPDLEYNERIVEIMNRYKDASVFNFGPVRGYVNLALQRGVYENIYDEQSLYNINKVVGKEKSVWILGDILINQLYGWTNLVVFDWQAEQIQVIGVAKREDIFKGRIKLHPTAAKYLIDSDTKSIILNESLVEVKGIDPSGILYINAPNLEGDIQTYTASINFIYPKINATNLTDENWDMGISRSEAIVLLVNSMENRTVLKSNPRLIKDDHGNMFHISKIIYDDYWIHVYTKESEIGGLKYPSSFWIH